MKGFDSPLILLAGSVILGYIACEIYEQAKYDHGFAKKREEGTHEQHSSAQHPSDTGGGAVTTGPGVQLCIKVQVAQLLELHGRLLNKNVGKWPPVVVAHLVDFSLLILLTAYLSRTWKLPLMFMWVQELRKPKVLLD